MKKNERQTMIEQLIGEKEIATQTELVKELLELGIEVTQATVSRDIQELELKKERNKEGHLVYQEKTRKTYFSQERLAKVIETAVLEVSQIEFVIVIRTALAQADVLAALLDQLSLPEIAGTLAGADTLIVFAHSSQQAARVTQFFKQILE